MNTSPLYAKSPKCKSSHYAKGTHNLHDSSLMMMFTWGSVKLLQVTTNSIYTRIYKYTPNYCEVTFVSPFLHSTLWKQVIKHNTLKGLGGKSCFRGKEEST